jgi:protein-tyrosine phosphatase
MDIKSVLNFRDAGGMLTSDGRCIKDKVIFRSATPDTISKRDINKLHDLNIRTIVDLRAPDEGGKKRRQLESFETVSLPLDFEGVTRERLIPLLKHDNAGELIPAMITDLYNEILDGSVSVFRSIVELLLDPIRTPMLIHCHAGKDRTGIICALIQIALDADRQSIVDNYMESNNSVVPHYKKLLIMRKILSIGFFPAEKILFAITVREDNILSVINRVVNHYGGIEGYFKTTGPLNSEFRQLRERFII